MSLLVELTLPAKPIGQAVNNDLAEAKRDMDKAISADNVKKAELRKQLEKCQ